jgi:hypothetical protein
MARPATTRLKVNPPLGIRPSLENCRVHDLSVDPSYQRSVDAGPSKTLIRRIAMYWDWGLFQPLIVARRDDGSLWVVDGQHRLEAAKLRRDLYDLPCVITRYASAAEEAASFVALNQQRRPLNRMQIYRAALAAGDEEARVIQAALEPAGLWIGSGTDLSIQKPGAITCLRGLEDCLRQFGPAVLAAALDVMARAFPGEVLRYSGSIFPGIAAIVADECKADRSFSKGERFAMMIDYVGAATQAEWYAEIGAKTAEVPTRRLAAATLFREGWAECIAELLDEAA